MLVYYILIFFPFLFKNFKIRYRNSIFIFNKTLVFFVLFFLILSLRDFSVGTDIRLYKEIFELISQMTIQEVFKYAQGNELAYYYLNRFVASFANFRFLLVMVAAFSSIMFYKLYNSQDYHQILRVILFCSIGIFPVFFSALRQSVALTLGILAFFYTRDKKPIFFIVTVLIAILFHESATVLFLMYPVYHLNFRRKWLPLMSSLLIIAYLFNDSLFIFGLNFLGNKYSNDYSTIVESGAYGMLSLYTLFLIFSFVIVDEAKIDAETRGLRNIMIVIVFFQLFSPISTIAMRMNYYFIILIPLLISSVIKHPKKRYQQVANLAVICLVVFFTFYFFWSANSGDDILRIFPYKSLWK